MQSTANINIKCSHPKCGEEGTECSSADSACPRTTFQAEYAETVTVECPYPFDCFYCSLYANFTNNTVLSGHWRYSSVFGQGISSALTAHCHNVSSCDSSNFYCPERAECNIQCDGGQNACRYSMISIPTQNTTNLNLFCPTDDPQEATFCEDVTFFCDDTGRTSKYAFSQKDGENVCVTDDCCPAEYQSNVTTMDCSVLFPENECVIECSVYGGCPHKTVIDGSAASSLTVICDDPRECQFVEIECPTSNGLCDVRCSNAYSCGDMQIEQPMAHSLSLSCSGSLSCEDAHIRIQSVLKSVNITCSSGYSCYSLDVALNVSDSVHVLCGDTETCTMSRFEIEGVREVTNVTITGNRVHALRDAQLNVQRVHSFTVHCIRTNGGLFIFVLSAFIGSVDAHSSMLRSGCHCG